MAVAALAASVAAWPSPSWAEPTTFEWPCGGPAPWAVSDDGRVLAFGCRDGVLHVVSATSGQELGQLPLGGRPSAVALSADGGRVAALTGGDQNNRGATASVWDVTTKRVVMHADQVDGDDLVLSPRGDFLVAEGNAPVAESYAMRATLLLNASGRTVALPAGDHVSALAFSPDNLRLLVKDATASQAMAVDLASGAVLWRRSADAAYCCTMTPEGLLFGGMGPAFVDSRTGEDVLTFDPRMGDPPSGYGPTMPTFADTVARGGSRTLAFDSGGSMLRLVRDSHATPEIVPEMTNWVGLTDAGEAAVASVYGLYFYGPSGGPGYLPNNLRRGAPVFLSNDRRTLVMSDVLNQDAIHVIDATTRREQACWEGVAGGCAESWTSAALAAARYSGRPADIVAAARRSLAFATASERPGAAPPAGLLIILARAQVDLGAFEAARQTLADAEPLVTGVDRIQVLTALGQTYVGEGHNGEAEPLFASAVDAAEAAIQAYSPPKGLTADADPARKALVQAAAVAAVGDSQVLIALSRPRDSIARLQRALARPGELDRATNARLLIAQARAFDAVPDLSSAAASWLRALDLLSDAAATQPIARATATAGYGNDLELQGRDDEAVKQLETGLGLYQAAATPETSDALLGLRRDIAKIDLHQLRRPQAALADLGPARKALEGSLGNGVAEGSAALTKLDRNRDIFRLDVEAAWLASGAAPAGAAATTSASPAALGTPAAQELDQVGYLTDGRIVAWGNGVTVWNVAPRHATHANGWAMAVAHEGSMALELDGPDAELFTPGVPAPMRLTGLGNRTLHFTPAGDFVVATQTGASGFTVVDAHSGAVVASDSAPVPGHHFFDLAISHDGRVAVGLAEPLTTPPMPVMGDPLVRTRWLEGDRLCSIRLEPVRPAKCVGVQIPLTPPLVLSPDGKRLYISSGSGDAVEIFDVATLTPAGSLKGHSDRITQIVYSPVKPELLTTSSDWTAQLIDLATGKAIPLIGHQGRVTDGAFSPDGLQVATVSADGTVRIWDAQTGALLAVLK